VPRLPAPTIRLRLTALYGGLFLVSGAVLLAIAYVLFRRASGSNLVVLPAARSRPSVHVREMAERAYSSSIERNTDALHQGLFRSVIVLAIMTVLSIAFGYLVAGRVLRPLREMTATTRQISERNLSERLDLPSPRDELKDLADTIDGLLGRLEAHVAEQQRFAANASHELRTPLATTQALLDVARSDPDHGGDGELIERLHAVNTRAIDLTEALLLLSRADQRSFDREPVDLSLIVEEATETLLPLAEKHTVTIEASGDKAMTTGSRPLLLQLATNLLHNAIVHNLPDGGAVWVTTTAHPDGAQLTVENTGEHLTQESLSTLTEPFLRGDERTRTDRSGVGLGLAIVKSIAGAHDGTLTLTPRPTGGLRVTVEVPGNEDRSSDRSN
jgi:two-component system, OmpR family, sensor histidine kinase VanS